MTKPPGKVLPLVAALLCGAVLAQAATPSDHSVTSAAAPVSPATGHGLLGTTVTSKRGEPSSTKQPRQPAQPAKPPVAKPPADDWNLAAHGKVLYLTFDDGPQHEWTPKVLQLLRKHKAHATFFVLGIQVAQYPELIAAERAAGHTIGNHTWDHKTLTLLPDAKVRQEIATGVKSKCLRPPTGATNAKIEAIAASYHQRQVLWDVDTKDWEKPGAASIEHAIMVGARPGAIILVHDGGGNRSQTVAALDRALTKLTKLGYTYRALPC
ncbi:peptidoglycan/xylan/chitin deacetylase (PgdA/CDA1 family) [Kribbella pratensis]|uniref:Peptidoglycan/xylan/chitin deacetylase (PgdA/CDA1 family) n=1 Tax=Kribbella pratensis TaxID=2512112 RepID=A0ABY2FPY2_9ACTN|nr:polysaccharide deacetylase family protein [Kribbella pratensis]TDW95209.1 peptidoglycan/xylan/chitin deacetylase (PgdA/CDA1 family) [Kribbella pratensis]